MGWGIGNYKNVNVLLGKTLRDIKVKGDEMWFYCTDGSEYKMYHDQDCCESVTIDDVSGDLLDLIGSPITLAEETSESGRDGEWGESHTWTFYRFATVNGYVDIKWYGSSNGYYSESVSFEETKPSIEEKALDKTYHSPYCNECGGCGEDGCCSAAACTQRGGDYCDVYLRELKFGYIMNKWFYNEIRSHISEELQKLYDDKWSDTYDQLMK